jgi:ferric-dicitrate binding protein FerR (iron transport regulator)
MTEHDPIEALLRATGRRPGVATERAARVRQAAHAAWRDGVRRTRTRRAVWAVSLAVSVVVALGVAMLFLRPAAPLPSGVRVLRVTGNAGPLVAGGELMRGQRVATGPGDRVALRAASGHAVRLDRMTVLRVVSGTAFSLERGAVYVDSGDRAAGGPGIRIETPYGIVEDRGTRFLVELATTGLTVRVREGAASVDVRGDRIVASTGEVVTVGASGEVVRAAMSPGDRSMDWAADVASPIEIEGVTLGAFLDWVVRERGVALRFDDPSLAEKARGIVLRGSIDGMTFDEAIDSVMATTGLRHRFEQDALVVSSP